LASVLNRKCGCDLCLQQPQPGIERAALELAALELERQRLVTHERFALPDHRAERDPRGEQHAQETECDEAGAPQSF
jgi:hypothetical protein